MSEPETLTVDVNGFSDPHLAQGQRPEARLPRRLRRLAALDAVPRRTGQDPHGDRAVAARLSRRRSRPHRAGFASGLAARGARDPGKADLAGADLAGSSVGASLAAEVAALWPATVRQLALIAPFGLFDEKNPPTDPWAQRADAVPGLMCADPEIWKALKTTPEGANSIEWPIEQIRANEAAARIFWPLGNTRIEKRLRLIKAPTLLLWGEQDKIMPRGYAEPFANGIAGPTTTRIIAGAGHLAELDKPAEVAREVTDFVGGA